MAEALGVASGAVGIVSFAIQIAQGLLSYYASWKGQDEDVAETCRSLESLSGTLKILNQAVENESAASDEAKKNIMENVDHVGSIMKRLSKKLDKIKAAPLPETGKRALLRRHMLRAYYPFKEATLLKLKEAIGEVRSNLDIALQVLQIQGIAAISTGVDFLVQQKQAGVGKTVLAGTIIEFLEKDLPSRQVGLAFVYCNHKEYLLQSAEFFIAAIAKQLLRSKITLPETLEALYETHRKKGTNPTHEEKVELLRGVAETWSEVYIVIDALDECVDSSGRSIWRKLVTDLKKIIPKLRLLCTCRDMQDLNDTLSGATRIEILASNDDIRSYVRSQIVAEGAPLEFCKRDPGLPGKIEQVIAQNSDQIFLAAQLYVDFLAEKTTPRAVKKALAALPLTLEENYKEAMERIQRQRSSDARRAMKALMFVVYAYRPMEVQEFLHAMATEDIDLDSSDPEDDSITEECLEDASEIVNGCAGLLRMDKGNNVLTLVHKTTQEYFDRHGDKYFPGAKRQIGITCLKYLSLNIFDQGPCGTPTDREGEQTPNIETDWDKYILRLKQNPLLPFAVLGLGEYLRDELIIEDGYHELRDLATVFFVRSPNKVSSAAEALFAIEYPRVSSLKSVFWPQQFSSFHLAASLGLTGVFKLLITGAADPISIPDTDGMAPLGYAASKGHEKLAELLISLPGTKVDYYFNGGYPTTPGVATPLLRAVKNGHAGIVRSLIPTNKVNVEFRDPVWHRNMVATAAMHGYEEILKMLLATEKVDVHVVDSHWHTPLSLAAFHGHDHVVSLLLAQPGVDPDPILKHRTHSTPLGFAAMQGHIKVVRQLLARGADPNIKLTENYTWAPGKPKSLTRIVAERGHEDVLKELLQVKHITLESVNEALAGAVFAGQLHIVNMLLSTEGARVDTSRRDVRGVPLICNASLSGNVAIIEAVHAAGADIDATDDGGRTALFLAAVGTEVAIAKKLLDLGAKPDFTETEHGETALYRLVARYSSSKWNDDGTTMLNDLLAAGADINAKELNRGFTPLLVCVRFLRGVEALRHLLANGADVNAQAKNGQTSVSLAAQRVCEEELKLLLDARADPCIVDNTGSSPLHHAVESMHLHGGKNPALHRIIRHLLDAGAPVDLKNCHGRTALSIAPDGARDIVRQLLDEGADPNF